MRLPAESCEITLDLGIFMLSVVGRLSVFTSLLGLCSFIYTHVFFRRYQSKLHLPVAAAAGPGDERLQAQGFLPLVSAGAEQSG